MQELAGLALGNFVIFVVFSISFGSCWFPLCTGMGCFRTKSSKVSEQLPFLSDIYEMTSAAQGRRKDWKSRGGFVISNPTHFEENILFLYLKKSAGGGLSPCFRRT